jgi:hypothetical protein
MKSMGKFVIALALACGATPAMAQQFPGKMIAEFYMTEMSVPKGWALSYKGKEGGAEVFVMDRDLDAFPQTGFLQPIEQMRRLMCGDDTLKAMVNAGTRIRVDARDKNRGKTVLTKGEHLTRC